ncbi:hypothetical protein ATCC90586_003797 [Pythium insidiosum]|nr:hypothetical protein ATCC90586_003797 [Pythium insidiosum]
MLAPPSDFGYSPAHHAGNAHHGGYDQSHHQHSGERPKLFGMDSHHGHGGHMHGLAHHDGMGGFQHMVGAGQHHGMTPQHHQGGEFDHEPLMMNMHNPQSHFYPALGGQMLHVSADYAPSMDGSTPSAKSGSKRSREELNLKEKKRMFKLNDRINQLKTLLDEAGVQSKKNKQSILDNTFHYIGMLRSNLLIAKQKAERAEKQAEVFRNQAKGGGDSLGDSDVFKQCFQQSSTPRLVVDLNMEPVAYNNAFLHHTGHNEDSVKSKMDLCASLCVDDAKFDSIIKTVQDGKRSTSSVVQARTASGVSTLTLVASSMADDMGKVVHIEFSLIPFEISSDIPQQTFHNIVKGDGQEPSPSGVADLTL